MHSRLVDFIICPGCLPQEAPVRCVIIEREGDDIITGRLDCPQCGASYPIEEGIADLSGRTLHPNSENTKYETTPILASYLWSHYGDLLGEDHAAEAYKEWAARLGSVSGLGVDAGCAVGRMTLEMSSACEFAVGLDSSWAFIQAARTLKNAKRMAVHVVEEGRLTTRRMIELSDRWDTSKVEFIVADAQALPFSSNTFSTGACLNLVDKLPKPLRHLQEMNRVIKKEHAQFLFSDPFSWSSDVAHDEEWLGGVGTGPFAGFGIDNTAELIKGRGNHMTPPWRIEEQGHVWWRLRTHRNHFELIRSQFIKAER